MVVVSFWTKLWVENGSKDGKNNPSGRHFICYYVGQASFWPLSRVTQSRTQMMLVTVFFSFLDLKVVGSLVSPAERLV